MTNPREMAEYFGFTEEEVKVLCKNLNVILRKPVHGMTDMN